MQEIRPEIYLDGAHNTGGIEAFVSAVKSLTQGDAHMPMLLFSMVRDKDVSGAVKLLVKEPLWDKIAVVSLPGERGCDAEELQSLFLRQMARGANSETAETTVQAFADEKEAFFSLQVKKKDGQKLFCTGSLYFVGAILGLLQDKMTDKTESR